MDRTEANRFAEIAPRLAAALNVALAHAEGTVAATWAERTEELAGCRQVLEEWEALP